MRVGFYIIFAGYDGNQFDWSTMTMRQKKYEKF